jgi:hypothetical protein
MHDIFRDEWEGNRRVRIQHRHRHHFGLFLLPLLLFLNLLRQLAKLLLHPPLPLFLLLSRIDLFFKFSLASAHDALRNVIDEESAQA